MECEVYIDGIHLEHVLKFKYFGCIFNESGTDRVECSRRVASWSRDAGVIRSLVNVRDLQLEYDRVLQETFLVPVLMYGSENVMEGEGEI